MAKRTLTVTTEFGTFTRTTHRDYTYVIVAGPRRFESREQERQAEMRGSRESIAYYRRIIDNGGDPDAPLWRQKYIAEGLASGEYAKALASARARLTTNDARGVITEDSGKPCAWGWSSRLDLARKEAASSRLRWARWVRIFDIATGQEVK